MQEEVFHILAYYVEEDLGPRRRAALSRLTKLEIDIMCVSIVLEF